MRISMLMLLAFLGFLSCKKNTSTPGEIEVANPITDKKGWKLVKYAPEFYTYANDPLVINKLELVKEHSNGIDILYSSILEFQRDAQFINVRWRAHADGLNEVKKVAITEIASFDQFNRPILSRLVNAFSAGMGESQLFVMNELPILRNGSSTEFDHTYQHFNAKSTKVVLNEKKMTLSSTQITKGGLGTADPAYPFVINGMNSWKAGENFGALANGFASSLGAAPKGNELVILAAKDSLLYVLETQKNTYTYTSGTYSENVKSVVVKNVYNLNALTKSSPNNYLTFARFCFNPDNLFVFAGMSNGHNRYFKINLNTYQLSSENEGLYEQVKLDGIKNLILPEDRPGEVIAMEMDGIYHFKGNTKIPVPSVSVQTGTMGTTVNYSNGKLWQVLFDKNGSYLISKAL